MDPATIALLRQILSLVFAYGPGAVEAVEGAIKAANASGDMSDADLAAVLADQQASHEALQAAQPAPGATTSGE